MAPTSEWLFVPGLPKRSPEIDLVWIPETWGELQVFFKPHFNRRSKQGVMSFSTVCRTPPARIGVRNLIASLTPDPSFCHNLCYKCPNGPCEPIFDIYTLIILQWYKEHPNVRCFDPCNQTLKFQESQRTPKSPFRECEFHPHTLSK
jgi:hypothetical protein